MKPLPLLAQISHHVIPKNTISQCALYAPNKDIRAVIDHLTSAPKIMMEEYALKGLTKGSVTVKIRWNNRKIRSKNVVKFLPAKLLQDTLSQNS